jgi:hypothetical protein
MGRLKRNQGQFFYSFCLDEVVPDDHRVREIAGVLHLSWVYAELACYYIVGRKVQVCCKGDLFPIPPARAASMTMHRRATSADATGGAERWQPFSFASTARTRPPRSMHGSSTTDARRRTRRSRRSRRSWASYRRSPDRARPRAASGCRAADHQGSHAEPPFVFCSCLCCAAGQRIVAALVQSENSVAVEHLLPDFQAHVRKKIGREFLDREADGIRGAGKSPVADGSPSKLSAWAGNSAASLLLGNSLQMKFW